MTLRASDRERLIQQNRARQEGWARWSKPSRYIVFILIIVGLLMGVWFLFEEREEHVPVSSLALVEADEEPYKIKVDEQEVLSVRHQDKLVYSRLHKGEEVPQVEHLLPEPEAPVALAEYAPEVQVIVEKAAHEVADSQPEGKDPIASLISGQKQKVSAGTYTVRVATMDSQEQAQQEWARLQRKHKMLLKGKQSIIEKVDLGKRGVGYTLEVGPYTDAADAEKVATIMKGIKVKVSNAPS